MDRITPEVARTCGEAVGIEEDPEAMTAARKAPHMTDGRKSLTAL